MADSPLSASPYEILGVPRDASEEELRRAYRRRARETHPDAGGSAAAFTAVQRAWEAIGTTEARTAYDRAASSPSGSSSAHWAPRAEEPRRAGRQGARASGHPGGWFRERYLAELREWVGLGDPIPDPYDPVLVARAPREVRHLLAAAVAEEETARRMVDLGMGFTVWHDVDTDAGKLDHVVLGPTGLWAVQSEDWGSAVRVHRGDLEGEGVPGAHPVHDVAKAARSLARAAHVRFSAIVMVLPDEDFAGVEELGRIRGTVALASERSRVVSLLRDGLPGIGIGGVDLFELRTRLAGAIRFV